MWLLRSLSGGVTPNGAGHRCCGIESGTTGLFERCVNNGLRGKLGRGLKEHEREVEGLQVSLAAAEDKLGQIDKRRNTTTTVNLATSTLPTSS